MQLLIQVQPQRYRRIAESRYSIGIKIYFPIIEWVEYIRS